MEEHKSICASGSCDSGRVKRLRIFELFRATPSEATGAGWGPPPFPIPGQEFSLNQAQASVPFKINLPAKLGAFVELKVLQPPQPEMPTVYIVYAAEKPSSYATMYDVVGQGGILLIEIGSNLTLQQAANNIRAAINSTKDYPDGGLEEVSINGYVGFAGGNFHHGVSWYTETTYYQLTANINYPFQQLLEIAQSIQVN